MKVYYHPLSFPSLGPLFTAEAAGADYESQVVNLVEREHKTPGYLTVNPFGRLPGLADGDFSMGESEAIMRYIARKSGSALYPGDIQGQAKVDQWMNFVNHHIRSPMGRVQFNRVIAKFFNAEPDESSLQTGLQFLENNLPVVAETLTSQPFLCGDDMTLADIALVAALEPAEMCGFDLAPYSAIKAWRETRKSESFYTNIHTHFGAEMGM